MYSLTKSVITNRLTRYICTSKFAHFNNLQQNALRKQSEQRKTGLFELDELSTPESFLNFKKTAVRDAQSYVDEATSTERRRKMDIQKKRFKEAGENASFAISSLVEKFNIDYKLYDALRKANDHGDIEPLTDIEKHVANLFLFDFEQSGIHLNEISRQEVAELNDKILDIGATFVQNTHEPRIVWKDSLPENLIQYFAYNEGAEEVAVRGLHAESSNAVLREIAYKIFLQPNTFQSYQLDELLSSRHKLANLCGFETYAHRALRGSIAETPENVHSFLTYLSEELRPRAEADYKEMLSMKTKVSRHARSLNAWDVPYYSAQGKMSKFVLKPDEYMAYLSLATCMEGLDLIFQSLYGVTLEIVETAPGEVWHPSVTKLAVRDPSISKEPIGLIYCDMFERQGKPHQDCHFTIQGGRRKADGSYQIPKVVLMLNLPNGSPPLLTPSLMDNLFHEMGHAMHSMLGRTEFQHVTGTRCATDLAEVPSILMEYFASDPRVVSKFARHYKTGEPMPADMAANLEASRVIFQASETQQQVFFAFLDQEYHSKHPLQGSTTQILERIQGQHYGVPYVPKTAWQLSFSHLVGYGAKYYSYLMSRAVAASFWHQVFKADPLSRKAGQSYREKVLAHGGSLPPRMLVQDFLNVKELSTEQLAGALIKDIDRK